MLDRLIKLQQDKKRFANGGELFQACRFDIELRKEIDSLSKQFLHRSPNGCSNCYMDAYLELINLDISKIKVMAESKFKLSHGVLLADVVNHDISKYMTVHNTTDELALYHLKTNPDSAKYFAELPEGWEKMVEEFKLEEVKKPTTILPKIPKKPAKPKASKTPQVLKEQV
jgi:hypothetical protein